MLARPAPLGSDVYFASEEGGWVRLFEYFVRDDGDSLDAADVTSHVPRYIPKGIREIATSAEHDCVFLLTSGAKNCVYHYKFYWSGENEKAQSAWGHWEFPVGTSVVAAECIGQYLYLVVVRSSGTWLERVDLSGTAVAPGMTHQVYLDRRYEVDPYYDTPTGYTIFTLPYAVPPAERSTYRIVRGAGNGANTGAMIDPAQFVWLSDTSVKVAGNVCPANCFVGHQYTMRFRFSRWFMRDGQNNPDLSGRLQIRTVTLYYTRAGYFATEVAPYGGTPDIEEVAPAMLSQFTGKTTGNTLLGAPAFDDGSYSFQVYGNSEDSVISITNDSHLGAWFTSAEVEFFWQKRARFA
jgi:hypothetical protein